MTATASLQPADTDAPRAEQSPAIAVMWMALVGFQGSMAMVRTRAINLPYLAVLWTPLAIAGCVALARRFFGLRPPERWPEGAPALAAMKRALGAAAILAALLALWSIVASILGGWHDPRTALPGEAMWAVVGWLWLMGAYVAERRPIPPPRERRSIWAEMQPIRSEHWGSRASQQPQ